MGLVWPDLAKFCNFGKILKLFGYIFYGCLVLGNILNPILAIFIKGIRHIFIVFKAKYGTLILPSGHTV